MTQRPLVWFTVCWVLGSSAAASMTGRGAALAGAAMLAALAAQVLLRRCSWPLAAACLAAFGLAAGHRMWTDARNVTALPVQYAAALAASPADGAAYAAELAGKIVSPPEIDGDRVQFRVAGDSIALSDEGGAPTAPVKLGGERMLVQVKLAKEDELQVAALWKRGQRVVIAGELTAPSAATNFGGFDYRAYLHGQRIHWLLGADGAAAVRASAGPRWTGAALLQRMDAVRAALGKRMDALYPGVQAGYMKGLVLGISDDLDPAVFRQFSQLGLTHILAISGLHVAVFLYVLGGLLRMLRMTRERMLLVMIAAVPFYVLLAGASPSVVRSGIMAMLGLAAARLHKLKDGLHLLAAAALLMLLWDPYMLGNVGFQLSFLVTAGLLLGSSPVRKLFPRGRRWWSAASFDLFSVTLVAQAVSLPLTIYYFNGLHLLSIAANLVLVPFISFVVMPLGGASLLLEALWHPAGVLLSQITALGNELTFGFILKLSGWTSFRLIWATPPLWWVVVFYAALGVLFQTLSKLQAAREGEERAAIGAEDAAGTNVKEEADSGDGTAAAGSRWQLQTVTAAASNRWHPQASEVAAGNRGQPQESVVTAGGRGQSHTGEVSTSSREPTHTGVQTALADSDAPADTIPLYASAASETTVWSAPFIELSSLSPESRKNRRFALAGAVIALAGLLLGAYFPDALDRNAYVDFIDVGQGDSVYIRTPGDKHLLIDGGGAVEFGSREAWRRRKDPFEVGRKTVVPLLRQRGVHHIDLLVLSHLDSDHIKGLLAVMEAIPVRAILWNGTVKEGEDAISLLSSAVSMGIPMYRAEQGMSWRIDGGVSIQVIGTPPNLLGSPLSQPTGEQGDGSNGLEVTQGANNAAAIPTLGADEASLPAVPEVDEQNGESVPLLVNLNGRQFLFTGDADAEEERSLLSQLQGVDESAVQADERATLIAEPTPASTPTGPIDVMKLSHHGSKTSTTDAWLTYWRPLQAVISVGRNNVYGHPHPTVIERLRDAGIQAARTDLDGEVQFRIAPDGEMRIREALQGR